MIGLISSYRLTNDVGSKIARIKGMPEAWSNPYFLPKLLTNPGPLFLYDKLLIDQRSYEESYNSFDSNSRKTIKSYIESEDLNLFELINAESVLTSSKKDYDQVESGFTTLSLDNQFKKLVETLEKRWGDYAIPSPQIFEAINIPVIELLRKKWAKKLKEDVSIIDDKERSLLYRIYNEKTLSTLVAPEIAKILAELTPKYFGLIPSQTTWTLKTIKKIREDEDLNSYRKKVFDISNEFAKKYSKTIKKMDIPVNQGKSNNNFLVDLENQLKSLQDDLYDEITESYQSLQNRAGVNSWSILGGTLAVSGAGVSLANPIVGAGLGMAGGVLILSEQVSNFFKKRSYSWVKFLETISNEIKRNN